MLFPKPVLPEAMRRQIDYDVPLWNEFIWLEAEVVLKTGIPS